MSKSWNQLGFTENPFNVDPLKVRFQHVPLLIGRNKESINFQTTLDSAKKGVIIISGKPGVGKTSFINIQQHLLESEEAFLGPKLLADRVLCPIYPEKSTTREIAIDILNSLCDNISKHCSLADKTIPKETKKVIKWLNDGGSSSQTFGLTIFGFGATIGGTITVPTINEVSFEKLKVVIELVASEFTASFDFNGCIMVLDNLENLESEKLINLLIAFRDTIFTINNIWWVLIGQSGLASFIQGKEPKVFQKITSNIELSPITVQELEKAVSSRVNKFRSSNNKGNSPISKNIYNKLYNSSNGEIRFVFNYCSQICVRFFINAKLHIKEKHPEIDDQSNHEQNKIFNNVVGDFLQDDVIPDSLANNILKEIIRESFEAFQLTESERSFLRTLGELKQITLNDYEKFSIASQEVFKSKFLQKFYENNFLLKKQEGTTDKYELRGLPLLAQEFNLI